MARIRTIKPEFWRSPSTAKASPRARLLYIAMWNWADDYGVAEWTPRELLGFAFPNDEEVTIAELQSLCTEVATCFDTQFYTIGGRRFYCIPAWDDHQKNERRAQGKYPRPDTPDACVDGSIHGVTEKRGSSVRTIGNTVLGTGEQGNRGTGEQGNAPQAALTLIPTVSFSDFWNVWPRKDKRKDAETAWTAAVKRANPERIVEVATQYANHPHRVARQFVPYGATWLRGDCWNDPMPLPPESERRPTRTEQNVDFVAQLAREQQKVVEA